MQLIRQNNILALKSADGSVVGFHARNLQVAKLDGLVWNALASTENADPEVLAELRQWNSEVDARTTDAHLAQSVRALNVNVAQVCNLKCGYCAAGGDGTFGNAQKHIELETIYDQLRFLLAKVPKGEEFMLTFFGGEPLIALDTIRVLARFAQLQAAGLDIRLRFAVITNGTLVTPEAAELLASIRCHVTVSLDGPPEINDKNRPTRGGFGSTAKTLAGLRNLEAVRERLGSLSVASVFGKHHTGVVETYKFLKQFNFDSIKFDFAAEDGDGENSATFADELAQVSDLAYREGGEKELRRLHAFNAYFETLDQQRRIQNHCGAGKDFMTSDAKGRLSGCQWWVGDKSEELGHGATLNQEKLADFASPLVEKNSCGNCWARYLCGGGCMFVNKLKSGSKHTKDLEFCKRTRTTIAKAIEHYAEARKTV